MRVLRRPSPQDQHQKPELFILCFSWILNDFRISWHFITRQSLVRPIIFHLFLEHVQLSYKSQNILYAACLAGSLIAAQEGKHLQIKHLSSQNQSMCPELTNHRACKHKQCYTKQTWALTTAQGYFFFFLWNFLVRITEMKIIAWFLLG